MSLPTWTGWPAVIASQNEDVKSYGILYPGRWDGDDRTWIPEVYDTGITWDTQPPLKTEDIYFILSERMSSRQDDLWVPVGENSTDWSEVQYPN